MRSVAPLSEALRQRWQHAVALVWGVVVLVVLGALVAFLRQPSFDTDVLALLPDEALPDRVEQAATAALGHSTADVLVVLRGDDRDAVLEAAATVRATLQDRGVALDEVKAEVPDARSIDAFAPFRRGLLTDGMRASLDTTTPEAFAQAALARLYAPTAMGPGPSVLEDPLGQGADWWRSRSRGIAMIDGEWWLAVEEGSAALLRFRTSGGAFRVDGSTPLVDAFEAARAAIAPIDVQVAGIPLIAEAAAAQANREMTTIGVGSLVAIVLLVALAFRSPLPVLLVASSLLVGIGGALVVTQAVFGSVHVLTLVFGASLVGVAEDYGIHYFAARQGDPARSGVAQMDRLLPGLLLALATSALAYAAIGLAPFPGLRQMALFSAVGLVAAFLTVACWFPLWPRRAPPPTGLSRRIANSLAQWPRLGRDVRGPHPRRPALAWGLVVAASAVAAVGLSQLRADDQLRSLQGVPPGVLERQQVVAELLRAPSPAQFFLVEADSTEALLQREEALIDDLKRLRADGILSDWQALSDAVPSARTQQANRARVDALEDEVRQQLGDALGEPLPSAVPEAEAPLDVATWLASPLSMGERALWLGEEGGRVSSVVRVAGIRPSSLEALSALGTDGVRWVDRTAQYSSLLATYRVQIQQWLALGVVAVAFALMLRFGLSAWRALVPTLLAGALALGVQGLVGEPLQLFNVLALMLLLGVGIDYGIFLLEHQDDGASWLAVSLGAASTLLGFGLLALSNTPALHGFGLTMLVGVGAVLGLSPLFRPPPREAAPPEHSKETRHAH
jgi:predicted exporter